MKILAVFSDKLLLGQSELRIKAFCQITVLMLAALIAATLYNCSLTPIITVNIVNTDSISVLSAVSVTSASAAESTATTDDLDNYITIAIINVYSNFLSLFFASNSDCSSSVDNSSVITLSKNDFTQYAFSTEWGERIYVSLNLNLNSSKIEDSYTDSSNIDVSYVDDYSVSIICSSERETVFSYNIKLFNQSDISCND